MAAERALLHDLGVIDDPFAAQMLSGAMSPIHRFARRLPRRTWSRAVTLAGLAGRVCWFDREVTDALDAGITQVVTIGAGYDSRPWRLRADGVRFFELDHPATQTDKRRRAPGDGPDYVAADLIQDDVVVRLVASPFDPSQPALFVVEGVTMYLEEPVVRHQLGALAAESARGSRLAVDFYPATRPDVGVHRRQMLLQKIARVGSSEGFRLGVDRDDAAALVADCGWEVTRVTSDRDAATTLVERTTGLPSSRVTESKTHVAATSR